MPHCAPNSQLCNAPFFCTGGGDGSLHLCAPPDFCRSSSRPLAGKNTNIGIEWVLADDGKWCL